MTEHTNAHTHCNVTWMFYCTTQLPCWSHTTVCFSILSNCYWTISTIPNIQPNSAL